MMELSPIILLALLLIGYPLVQILAIRLRRGRRLAFNALIMDLEQDTRYASESEQAAIHSIAKGSRGSRMVALAPLVLPLLAVVEILSPPPDENRGSLARSLSNVFEGASELPASSPLWNDPRLTKIMIWSMDLMVATYPISVIFGAIIAAPFVALAVAIRWLRVKTLRLYEPRYFAMRLARVLHVMAD